MLRLIFIAIFCFSVLTAYLLTPHFIQLFVRGNSLAKNFRGELIPQGIGVIFALYTLPWYTLYLVINNYYPSDLIETGSILIMITALYTASLLGFMDDILGSRDALGLKGHIRALLSGKLTTGIIKAAGVFLISLIASIFLSFGFWTIILNTLLTALFTNLLNMLDLRPGRAVKFYIFLTITFGINALLTGRYYSFILILPIISSVIGYFPFDLKARCMMGDAGSNLLGISAGILSVIQSSYFGKLILLFLLIMIHVITEKHSLSDVIKHSRLLSFFDNLGRECKDDQLL